MAGGDLVAWPAGNVLFPAPLYERGFKAEFGYDSRIGFTPCDHDPLGWEEGGLFTAYKKDRDPFEVFWERRVTMEGGGTCRGKWFVELIWGAGV